MNGAQNKRLSVIIPGYNNPDEWWDRCIQSVILNVEETDEIICVDDYSSSIPESIIEWTKKDPRVRLIRHKKNEGLSAARNTGLVNAQGKYVTFVDSDDEIREQIYAKSINMLVTHTADIVVFGVCSIWVNERLRKEDVPPCKYVGELGREDILELKNLRVLNYAWNKVYRADFLKANGLRFDNEGVPCEDIIFILECILHGAKWCWLDHVGINYYRTHATLLSRYKPTFVVGMQKAALLWKEVYKKRHIIGKEISEELVAMSDRNLMLGQWDNIWRLGSPYKMVDNWKFLNKHLEICNRHPLIFMTRTIILRFLRRYCYIRPVQKWHIRRVFPNVRHY